MPYPELNTINGTTDITEVFIYANNVTDGLLSPLILGFMFVVVMFGTFFTQQRALGRPDFVVSFAASAYVTTGLSFIMLLRPGLLNPVYSVVCVVGSIVATAILFASSRS